jgi:hypothetical protein
MGDGFAAPVNALLVHGDFLYAGTGDYTNRPVVSRWDGRSWTDMQSNLEAGAVNGLFTLGDELYAAGSLVLQGLSGSFAMIHWNGAAWDTVAGIPHGFISEVIANEERAYLAGEWTGDGMVGQWDGREWKTLANGSCNYYWDCDVAVALAIHESDLYVGGHFPSGGNLKAGCLFRLRNGTWQAIDGISPQGYVFSLASTPQGLMVGGYLQFASGPMTSVGLWTGSSWKTLGSGLDGAPFALTKSGDGVVAGGEFLASGSQRIPYCGRWDGLEWTPIESRRPDHGGGLLEPTSIAAIQGVGDRLYVAGQLRWRGEDDSATPASRFAWWDGRKWNPEDGGVFLAITDLVEWQGRLIGAGPLPPVGRQERSAVASFDGSRWEILGEFDGPIHTLAARDRFIYAGGHFGTDSGGRHIGVMCWDGTQWSQLALPVSGSPASLAMVWQAGFYNDDLVVADDEVARWDGARWHDLGRTGMYPQNAIVTYHGELLIGGRTGADSLPAVQRWDGQRWVPVPGAPAGVVEDLEVIGDELYAIGHSSRGGAAIARWDGERWHSLGSGVAGTLRLPNRNFLTRLEANLFAAGTITFAGGKSSFYIARWDPPTPHHRGPVSGRAVAPRGSGLTISYSVEAAGRVVIDVFDLAGRRVIRHEDPLAIPGAHTYTWDGRGGDGQSLPPGLYFARLTVAGEPLGTARVILTR